jgi:hypothetical protein
MDKKIIESLKLNNYSELDNFFEISSIKDEEFILRNIRRKIIEKFEQVIDIFTTYLHPNSVFIEMYDARSLDEKDHEQLVKILKDFAVIIKQYHLLEIESNDDSEKEFFNNALNIYKSNLVILKSMIEKVKSAYGVEDILMDRAHYLG